MEILNNSESAIATHTYFFSSCYKKKFYIFAMKLILGLNILTLDSICKKLIFNTPLMAN